MGDRTEEKEKAKKLKEKTKRGKKTKLTRLDRLVGLIGFKSELQKKIEKEEHIKETILARQRRLEDIDVTPQTWNFVFGDETPSTYSDVHQIVDVTPRNIWMENDFIMNQIYKFAPDKTFHKISIYTLKYQPPNSPFRLLIPLDDWQLLENVIIRMANLSDDSKSKVLFYFSPTDPMIPLFAPHVSPFALVKFKTKAAVLGKLCDQYLDHKINLDDFTQTLLGDFMVWKQTTFNLMSDEEQSYHRYLLDRPIPTVNLKKMAKKYHNSEITLQEYVDYKFPERKKQRDTEALEYPRPYNSSDCIICFKDDCATIKCQNCPNMVCKDCIQSSFLDPDTKLGSFLHMHRLFCMKRGRAINRLVDPCGEPSFLVQLKETGRLKTHALLSSEAAERERKMFEDKEEVEDDGYDSEEERRRRHIADELAKASSVHPELVEMTEGIIALSRTYRRIKRDLLQTQLSLDKRHDGKQYLNRLYRLRNSDRQKFVSRVQSQLLYYQMRLSMLPPDAEKKAPETFHGVNKEVHSLLENVDMLLRMENAKEYFDGVAAMQHREEEILRILAEQAKATELLKYSSL